MPYRSSGGCAIRARQGAQVFSASHTVVPFHVNCAIVRLVLDKLNKGDAVADTLVLAQNLKASVRTHIDNLSARNGQVEGEVVE